MTWVSDEIAADLARIFADEQRENRIYGDPPEDGEDDGEDEEEREERR